jgi:hypothetical protein
MLLSLLATQENNSALTANAPTLSLAEREGKPILANCQSIASAGSSQAIQRSCSGE